MRAGDYVLPVCEDGLAQSQVLHAMLKAVEADAKIKVAPPHGALSGCDPHVGYIALTAGNMLDYAHTTAVDDLGASDWSAAGFAAAFGSDKAERVGEEYARSNGLQLNPTSASHDALRALSANRSTARMHLDETYFNVRALRRQTTSVRGRVIFFTFDRAVKVILQRLLEVNGDSPRALNGVSVVVMPPIGEVDDDDSGDADSSSSDVARYLRAFRQLAKIVRWAAPPDAGRGGDGVGSESSGTEASEVETESDIPGGSGLDDGEEEMYVSPRKQVDAAEAAEDESDGMIMATVSHGGVDKEVLLYAGISPAELAETLKASFGIDEEIAGLRDTSKGISFPLSLMSQAPLYFSASGGATSTFQVLTASVSSASSSSDDTSSDAASDDVTSAEDDAGAASGSDAGSEGASDTAASGSDDSSDLGRDESGARAAAEAGAPEPLLALSDYDADKLIDMFVDAAPSGLIDRDTFSSVMQEYVWKQAHHHSSEQVVNELFEIFDRDGNGLIDSRELLSGLVVLCSGDHDKKVRAAFELYDTSQSGYITFDDMVRFLQSVFRVVGKLSPGVFTLGDGDRIDPDDLAHSTALQSFEEADARRHSDRISYEQFRAWYAKPESTAHRIAKVIEAAASLSRDSRDAQSWPRESSRPEGEPSSSGSSGKPAMDAAAVQEERFTAMVGLDRARQYTGLGALTAGELYRALKEQQIGDTGIARSDFLRGVTRALRKSGHDAVDGDGAEAANRLALLDQLYDSFDEARSNSVDLRVLVGGVLILSNTGSIDDAIRTAFYVLDSDSDGVISEEELQTYLTSVFAVCFACISMLPESERPTLRYSAAQLGAESAREVMAEADTDQDGKISKDEFIRFMSSRSADNEWPWFGAASGAAAPSIDVDDDGGAGAEPAAHEMMTPNTARRFTIEEMRRITNLGSHDVEEVLDVFAEEVGDDGHLDYNAFLSGFAAFLVDDSDDNIAVVTPLLQQLFEIFDVNGDGVVDYHELASGLTVLCDGDRDDKISAIFNIFDVNGDGFISLEELTLFLTSVNKMMFASDPDIAAQQFDNRSAEEVARLTATKAMEEADTNRDGKLSLDEFRAWYTAKGEVAETVAAAADVQGSGAAAPAEASADQTSEDIARDLGLVDLDPEAVLEYLSGRADDRGRISRAEFVAGIVSMLPETRDESLQARHEHIAGSYLFDRFDTNRDGELDLTELAAGVSTLCGGSSRTKSKAAFSLYDLDNDGYISRQELESYLISVFRLALSGPDGADTDATAEQLAATTAQVCFEEADHDNDGRLSFDEFHAWYVSRGGSDDAESDNETDDPLRQAVVDGAILVGRRPSWVSFAEVRRLTNLENYDVSEVIERFSAATEADGLISRGAFVEVMGQFVNPTTAEDLNRVGEVLSFLFDMFDRDKSGKVDFVELTSGLSVLCGGKTEDKVDAMFHMFDLNGDGYVTVDELRAYLESSFRMVLETQTQEEGADHSGSDDSREELVETAARTADRVLREADLDHDGLISLAEFRAWWLQSASASPETGYTLATAANPAPEWISLAEVKRITNLNAFSVDDIANLFAEYVNDDGVLGLSDFFNAFRSLVVPPNQEEAARLQVVMRRLFDLFDMNGDGVVDFSELVSGLSVLTAGTPDAKVDSTFALFDANGSGYINKTEMTAFLQSVYRVLFEAQPGTYESLGVEPDELARITTDECFREADLPGDGRISLGEFKDWFTNRPESGFVGAAQGAAALATETDEVAPSWQNLEEVKRVLSLHTQSVAHVIEALAEAAVEEGWVSRAGYLAQLRTVARVTVGVDAARAHYLAMRLFALFDPQESGRVDFVELACGVSVLCSGDRAEKIYAIFGLFGGSATAEELLLYMASVFKVLTEFEPRAMHAMSSSIEQLAVSTVVSCFRACGINPDGHITAEVFVEWYLAGHHDAQTQLGDASVAENAEAGAAVDVGDGIVVDTRGGSGAADVQDNLGPLQLSMVKAATRLREHNVEEVIEAFAAVTNPDGHLTRRSFYSVLEMFAMPETAPHAALLRDIADRLFDAFDNDDSSLGLIDFAEVAAGISVLCGGSVEEMVESAFGLFDFEGDGFLYRIEFELYVLSVLRVLFVAESSLAERASLSAADIASMMADSMYGDDPDGRLSLADFKQWYDRWAASVNEAVVQPLPGDDAMVPAAPHVQPAATPVIASPLSLTELRRLTNLESVSAPDLVGRILFVSAGSLNRAAFDKVFSALGVADGDDADRQLLVLDRLFDLFDRDNEGRVDASELAAGLCLLCGGPRDHKLHTAFMLFDADEDAALTHDELSRFLWSMFTVLYEFDPDNQATLTASAEDMAAENTDKCFAELDISIDGAVDWNQFCGWYSSGSTRHAATHADAQYVLSPQAQAYAAAGGAASVAQSTMPWHEQQLGAVAAHSTLEEARRIVGLVDVSISDLMEALAQFTDSQGTLDMAGYFTCFAQFLAPTMFDARQLAAAEGILGRVFALFDDGSGHIDYVETCSGLSVLCGGNPSAKVASLFFLFDLNGDGEITPDEMVAFLEAVFKVMYEFDDRMRNGLGGSPRDLALHATARAFSEADVDHDGKITYEEFRAWHLRGEASLLSAAAPGGGGGGGESIVAAPVVAPTAAAAPSAAVPVVASEAQPAPSAPALTPKRPRTGFDEARELTDLASFAPEQVYDVFASVASSEGTLDADAFRSAFDALLPEDISDADRERVDGIVERLFVAFDSNGDGEVDFVELGAGLSVLCGGSREEKARAAFALFDLNGDGVISKDEMVDYLRGVFRVVFETQPETAAALGVSADSLARVTAQRAFDEADVDGDGVLTIDEVIDFYRRHDQGFAAIAGAAAARAEPEGAGAPAPSAASEGELAVVGQAVTPAKGVDVAAVREILRLDHYHVAEVFSTFQEHARNGVLTPDAFARASLLLVALAGGAANEDDLDGPGRPGAASLQARPSDVLVQTITDVFHLFDKSGDNVVNFVELAAGMSLFCRGSAEDKVRAAFPLYDQDGSGFLSLSEMTDFLAHLFHIFCVVDRPAWQARVGVSPQELADATALTAFEAADTNRDGRIDVDEFVHWYSNEGMQAV